MPQHTPAEKRKNKKKELKEQALKLKRLRDRILKAMKKKK